MVNEDSKKIARVVTSKDSGLRLDAFVGELEEVKSRSAAVRLIESGKVQVFGEKASKKYLLKEGQTVHVEIPVETVKGLFGEQIPLDIRYEDEYLMVISKQPGLVCHPTEHHTEGTLVNALIYHCGLENLGSYQGEDRPGIVHRLDRDTSGLMLVAKDAGIQEELQEQIKLRAIDRRYLTLVHGTIAPETGLIDAPIARDERNRLKMTVSELPSSRQAVTTFTVLERFDAHDQDDGFTLLECKLYTGRTHQIRVHMHYIKHPVVGDQTYGQGNLKANLGLTRQFLHSHCLSFTHPVTGEALTFKDRLPDDLFIPLGQITPESRGRTDAGHAILADDL